MPFFDFRLPQLHAVISSMAGGTPLLSGEFLPGRSGWGICWPGGDRPAAQHSPSRPAHRE